LFTVTSCASEHVPSSFGRPHGRLAPWRSSSKPPKFKKHSIPSWSGQQLRTTSDAVAVFVVASRSPRVGLPGGAIRRRTESCRIRTPKSASHRKWPMATGSRQCRRAESRQLRVRLVFSTLYWPLAPLAGTTPSCCIMPRVSIRIRLSAILLPFKRSITIPFTATCLPVAGTPRNGPR
jgi:hypothetical protein